MTKSITEEIILTIAIPTHNGAVTIATALQSVLHQITPNVEVIVSDNSSEDETSTIVQEYCKKYKCLKYFKNEKNVGYDKNVNLSMQRAVGDFVWLLGDDDIILPGGILEILNIISLNPSVGVIFANCPHPVKVSTGGVGLCSNGDDFFKKTRFKSGFVSTNVFNRKLWSEIDVSKYFDSAWIHIGFLMEALTKSSSYVTEKYCVDYIREETSALRWGGNGSFINTGMKLVRIYKEMSTLPYSRKTQRCAFWSVKGGYWRNICLAKAKGFEVDLSVLKQFYDLYKNFYSFWLLDLPILLVPSAFFKALFRVYKSPWGSFVFRRWARS